MPDLAHICSDQSRIIVVDLDGTLVLTNSFHRWLLFCLVHYIRKGEVLSLGLLVHSTLLRATKYLSHEKWKRRVLKITAAIPEGKIKEFVLHLDRYTNQDVSSKILQKKRSGNYLNILCTAAPSIYAVPYATLVGIDHVIATPMCVDDDQWKENSRHTKLFALANHLSIDIEKMIVDTLFTDHHDDLPLMTRSRRIELINPSPDTLERMSSELPDANINITRCDI